MRRPLDGIRALDFGRAVQIPGAMNLLAEWGADVIKIEELVPDVAAIKHRIGPTSLALDRGKKSLAVNVKDSRGVEILRKLAATSDVVGENFRLGVMDKLGLGYEDLRRINPRLIYASGRGYGSKGPRRFDPGYDPVGQAMGGMMHLNGEKDGYPLPAGYAIVDYMSSMHVALGIMVALFDREHTGVGQHLETSLLGSTVHSQNWAMAISWSEGRARGRLGRRAGGLPSAAGLPATYRTSDGYLQIMNIVSDRNWPGFCRGLRRLELLNDERFNTEAGRIKNSETLQEIIEAQFAAATTDEWVEALQENQQIVSPILDHDQIKDNPQVRANDYVVDIDHPLLGSIPAVGHPIKFSEFAAEIASTPPELGEHSQALLEELGYSAADIAQLREQGVIQV